MYELQTANDFSWCNDRDIVVTVKYAMSFPAIPCIWKSIDELLVSLTAISCIAAYCHPLVVCIILYSALLCKDRKAFIKITIEKRVEDKAQLGFFCFFN